MSSRDLKIGDTVTIPWGLDEVVGRIVQIYGPLHGEKVVVGLSPDVSGWVVDEPTTVTLPIDAVHLRVA
jgi:hypothetical protein